MNKKNGFTLIEVVMVIVIIGILSAVAIPKYISYKRDARVAVVDAMWHMMKLTNDAIATKLITRRQHDNVVHAVTSNLTTFDVDGVPTIGSYIAPSGFMYALDGFDKNNDKIAYDNQSRTNPNGWLTYQMWRDPAHTWNVSFLVAYSLSPYNYKTAPGHIIDCGIVVWYIYSSGNTTLKAGGTLKYFDNPAVFPVAGSDALYFIKGTNGC